MSKAESLYLLKKAGRLADRAMGHFFGFSEQEGELSDLRDDYKKFLTQATDHVGIVFPELPQEIFTDPEVLHALRGVVNREGRVDVICSPNAQESSPQSVAALSSMGARIYLTETSYHFTILDRGIRWASQMRQLGRRGETEWRQTISLDSMGGFDRVREFLKLRDKAQALEG